MAQAIRIESAQERPVVEFYLPRPVYTANFALKDLYVDLRAHRVWRAGREVAMTPREYALLAALITHHDRVLTREELLSLAWGYEYIGVSRTVDVHVNRVRCKLGLQHEIQTVFKVGYRLDTHSAP